MCDYFETSFQLFEDLEKDLSPIYGNWEVKENGNLVYNGDGNRSINEIEQSQLPSIDLVHVISKAWKNYEDAQNFFLAYLEALRNAGHNKITIDLQNHFSTKVE